MKLHPLTNLLLALALLLELTSCALPVPSPEGDASSSADASSSQTSAEEEPPVPFTLPFYPDSSIHPALADNRTNLALAGLLYEGLFTLDESFQAVPVLCESYFVSEDGLTWLLNLRQGVTFSDGTPLTGTLAAQALNTALGTGSRYAGRISGLRAITGSEEAVTITLYSPNGALPALLDIPISLDNGSRPLGTGPYVLDETDSQTILSLRSDWWQQRTLPFDSIRLRSIRQADDLIAAFDSGDVTLLDADLAATNALGYSGSYEVWDYGTPDLVYLGFNTEKGVCKDTTVRQAISLALDRETIATIPYARHATAASLPVHPDSPLYDQALADQSDSDPSALVQLMQTHTSLSQPIKLIVNSENSAKVSAAQYVAYQLEALGLTVEVEKLTWDSFVSALSAGSFDLYVGEVLLTADFDLSALLSSSGALNYGRWADAQTDQLLWAFSAADDESRPQAALQLYQSLSQTVPITPLCFKSGSLLTQWGRLSGLTPVYGNAFHDLEDWTFQ